MVRHLLIPVAGLLVWAVSYLVADYRESMVMVSSQKLRVPVIDVRELVINVGRGGGKYLNWVATVRLDSERTAPVRVFRGPVPAVGDCMPVVVGYFQRGGVQATLVEEAWRYGGYFAAENRC